MLSIGNLGKLLISINIIDLLSAVIYYSCSVVFPKFNKQQRNRLSEILGNFGLLLIASLVFPLVTGGQNIHSVLFTSGIILSAISFIVSLNLLK